MTPLILDPTAPSVTQAKASEAALFEDYGIKVRVTEFGSGDPVAIVPGNTGDALAIAPAGA